MWSSLVGALMSLFNPPTYGTELEQYIISRNPKSVYDVEKYTLEYHNKKDFI